MIPGLALKLTKELTNALNQDCDHISRKIENGSTLFMPNDHGNATATVVAKLQPAEFDE